MTAPLVLVVEDERLIARDIALQLQDMGYVPVGIATTGEQAIEMAEKLRPQLVLMDIHLGSKMDGITAAQAIRNQFGIPTIFLSSFDNDDSLARAKQTQPAGFLSKPFVDYELHDAMLAALKVDFP